MTTMTKTNNTKQKDLDISNYNDDDRRILLGY